MANYTTLVIIQLMHGKSRHTCHNIIGMTIYTISITIQLIRGQYYHTYHYDKCVSLYNLLHVKSYYTLVANCRAAYIDVNAISSTREIKSIDVRTSL